MGVPGWQEKPQQRECVPLPVRPELARPAAYARAVSPRPGPRWSADVLACLQPCDSVRGGRQLAVMEGAGLLVLSPAYAATNSVTLEVGQLQ